MTDQFRDPLTSRPGLAELLQTHARTAQELLGHTTVQILPLEEIEKRSAAHEAAYRAIESWVSQRTLTEADLGLLRRLAKYAIEAAPQQGERENDDATQYFQDSIDANALARRLQGGQKE